VKGEVQPLNGKTSHAIAEELGVGTSPGMGGFFRYKPPPEEN